MDRFLIVDGSNLLFQMFFGMPARIVNEQGKAIQGTLGFVGALLRIIRRLEPTHAAVLFDGEHSNDRILLNADYKANRVDYGQLPEEESPFSQLPDVYAALDCLQIRYAETTDCETDDWIAGYTKKYGRGAEIIIASYDSDFFQLITDRVSILRYRGENSVMCTPSYIEEKLGVAPCRYADFKSLTGDASDNIKGADKIGPKTAAALLRAFGDLEGILCHAQDIKKPSVRQSVMDNAERLRTNYRLIRLEGADALPFTLEDLVFTYDGTTTTDVLRKIGLR